MKFFDPQVCAKEVNRQRFDVLKALAKGRITTAEAKRLCGVTNAINQKAVFVARGDAEYVRLEAGVSSLSH